MSEQNTTEYDANLNKTLAIPVQNSIDSSDIDTIDATNIKSGGLTGELKLGPNGLIYSQVDNVDRVKFGKIDDTPRYGIEVLDENGDILFNEKKLKIQYTFSTFMSSPSASGADVTGWVHYGTTDYKNVCIRLDFVKPADFTITSATIYYRMQDFLADSSTRLKDIDIYLNPTKTLVNGAAYQDYYRYSGGDLLATNIDPDSDEYEGDEDFSSDEIDNISDGWNYIIAQQSFDDSAFGFMGYCSLNLVLTGYLEP